MNSILNIIEVKLLKNQKISHDICIFSETEVWPTLSNIGCVASEKIKKNQNTDES